MRGARPAPLALPQPAAPPQQPPAVRTLQVRVAESLDRMSSFARGGLVALTIVGMFMLGVSVLSMGVRSATRSMEELQRVEAAEAAQDAADAARYEQGGYDDDEDRD